MTFKSFLLPAVLLLMSACGGSSHHEDPAGTYTITASAGSGGTISPEGALTVKSGDDQTFTITPNSGGYSIASVTVDGTSVGAVSTYKFSKVQANHTISATFNPPGTFIWKGHTWTATTGTHGPGPNHWSASNVFVDANGKLHLKITQDGSTWNCASLSTADNLGFGTYQWVVETRIDNLDPNVVFGLFNYGGTDYVDEIDIEYTRWQNSANNNCWFTVYPNRTYSNINESDFTQSSFLFDLIGKPATTTSRLVWSQWGAVFTTMSGVQPVGTTSNVLGSWTDLPNDFANAIPQNAMPQYIDLWLRGGSGPSDGNPVEIVLSDFTFTPGNVPPASYVITATAGTGGSISPSGSVNVSAGSDQAFTITPDSGYVINTLTVDGASIPADQITNPWVFHNVYATHSIAVTFRASAPVTNLLTNPGFESGLSGWDDWGGLTASADTPHSGTGCLAITLGDGGGAQEIPVGGRTSVTLGGWGRASVSGENAVFGLDFLDSSNAKIGHVVVGSVTATAWTYAEQSVSVPDGTVTIRVWVYHNPGPGTVYFDDLDLY